MRGVLNVSDICDATRGDCKVLGDPNRTVSGASSVFNADPDSVSFCKYDDERGLRAIRGSRARIIICSDKLEYETGDYCDRTLIVVPNPRLAFVRVMQRHFEERPSPGIDASAVVHGEAKVHPTAHIGPNSVLGKCEIGENTILHGSVHIYSDVRIGRNVIINAGSVVGSDGYGYEKNEDGEWERFPQIGGVIIEDEVEIGSGVCIDRAALDNTVIGQGTKIDNLVHIAHNVVIGKNCLVIAVTFLGGSVQIGDGAWIAPGVTIREGIRVGSNAMVGMSSLVNKDVAHGSTVFGVPARVR